MTPRPIAWLIAACLPLMGWWTYGLFDLDEGFYAAVAAEMNRRGEWVTPYYNGRPWFEKPILLYWLAKPSIALFGEMIGPRLPSILATVATVWLLFWFLRRRVGEAAGIWSALVYGSSLLVVATGRMMLTDPLLVLFLTAALTCFWESLAVPPEGGKRGYWRAFSAASLGLAVLAKGPVAGILFVLVAGIAYWRQPGLRPAYRGGWLAGSLVFALMVASWYVPAYLANGELFVREFLIEQNVGRFTGGDEAHSIGLAGLLIYPLVLFIGMLPWSVHAFRALDPRPLASHPRAASSTPRDTQEETLSLETYLRIWFWTVFAFFTVSGAKLPHYILPAVPPLAVLPALRLSRHRLRWTALVPVAAVWTIAQLGFSLYYYGGFGLPGFHAEVHRLARYVHEKADPTDTVVLYQLSRREKSRGTGKPKIQETSHPSLMLYLDRTTLDTDEMAQVLAAKPPVWIITRWNRIDPDEEKRTGIEPVPTPFEQDLYRLYLKR